MTWKLSHQVDLASERIPKVDSDRQMRTAEEICGRLNDQFGVILADGVGTGKTFVALAVAASVALETRGRRPVVVMVPSSVKEKWPKEWAVFTEHCLPRDCTLRATETTVTRGSAFLKLLDDDSASRKHIIFLTHGALTSKLNDPFTKLAIIRQAFLRRRSLASQRTALERWASKLLGHPPLRPDRVHRLLNTPPAEWRGLWRRMTGEDLGDDPVPDALIAALADSDLSPLRNTLATVPLRRSTNINQRLAEVRTALKGAVESAWRESLRRLDVRLPLVVLDEAHHLKNPNQLAHLFASADGQADAEALTGGPLGDMFERMLFLTATPFQLGHQELLNVLRRFEGVRATRAAKLQFRDELQELSRSLDGTQAAALRLERAWGRLTEADLEAVRQHPGWWAKLPNDAPEAVQLVVKRAEEARQSMRTAEERLRPWVIRHERPDRAIRRSYQTGQRILVGAPAAPAEIGLEVDGQAVLPFLLAARAQAVVALTGLREHRRSRAYFAEGLASSFEAYAETRSQRIADHDEIIASESDAQLPDSVAWYLDHIEDVLPVDDDAGWVDHPKVAATTDRVVDLWQQGEKTLVFCFYRATGRALRIHISRALQQRTTEDARAKLGRPELGFDALVEDLEGRADRLFRKDSPGARMVDERVRALVAAHPLEDDALEHLVDAVTRFMRTPSFLVRHVDLTAENEVDALADALERPDQSAVTLANKVERFARYLSQLVPQERDDLMSAVLGIQTGSISTAATAGLYDPAEEGNRTEATLPNVRLANGAVRAGTRHRLMLAFNTPFFPEVLIASAVMAEGVDLHLDCRHVIHHDLDWNPSVLEQRTGRLDRINSKAELARLPVVVYEPFVGGTQDEKMFRVVKDRERWFNVVMGQPLDVSEWATDRAAERIPLPEALAAELSLRLSV